jgi:UDPglucose--hexose-1-phosphate uridylyltransferase
MPEIRTDPVTGHRVILAPERARRPDEFAGASTSSCPFCAGQEAQTPAEVARLPGPGGAWRARVVPNKYPAVGGAYAGAHEVVIESARHATSFASLPLEDVAAILGLWRDRTLALRDRGVKQLIIFKNEGASAGASLEHVHSQILASAELEAGRALLAGRLKKEGCPICADRDPARDVASRGGLLARVPHAPRFPHEVRIAPAAHRVRFEEEKDVESLAGLILEVLGRLRALLGAFDYNLAVQVAPFREPDFHWHVEVLPRTSRPGGCEWGTGVFINTAAPEESARRLREARP